MKDVKWWKAAIRNAKSIEDIEWVFRKLWPDRFPKPPRRPLFDFPDVIIHASESFVKKHVHYAAAKKGDAEAAGLLVKAAYSREAEEAIRHMSGGKDHVLVSVHAAEDEGINAIPDALAKALAETLNLRIESGIIQSNVVWHTAADGFGRIARQPEFEGDVIPGQKYLIVDDFVGMGGTIANLKGYIESKGGIVIGVTTLTGKPYSAKIALDRNTWQELRDKHGREIEDWWEKKFGHAFDCLTQSEARYLARTKDADTIRKRIAAAEQEGDLRGPGRKNED